MVSLRRARVERGGDRAVRIRLARPQLAAISVEVDRDEVLRKPNQGCIWSRYVGQNAEHRKFPGSKRAARYDLNNLNDKSYDICGFKAASGEILSDEGVRVVRGYLENGAACKIRGHVTDARKPLISAGRMAIKNGLMSMAHSLGGHVTHQPRVWD